MIKYLILLSGLSLFLALKFTNIGVRLSDTNIYFYTAYQILQGQILYKDFFFSNFPLFAYISSLYFLITKGTLELFFLTASVEVILTSILIFYIVQKQTKEYLISITSTFLYLFSFLILSTSDHQTGVFSASLFTTLSFLFWQRKQFLITGVFLALSILTKAYYLPVALTFISYFVLKKEWRNMFHLLIGATTTSLIVLLPSLISAPKQFIIDIFGFSLTRPVGASKHNVAWFFISKDILLFLILIFNLFNIKKALFFGLFSMWAILFFFSFKDIYYLYLNFLAPFLCISFPQIIYFFKKKFQFQITIFTTITFAFIALNIFIYNSNYKNLQKVNDMDKIISTIDKEKPNHLYGIDEFTASLLYLTKLPPVDKVFSAHEYFFMRGIYDRKLLTQKAIKQRSIIISHGAFYPELGIKEDLFDGIFDKENIYKNCKIILAVPVKTEGPANRINFFKCY